MAGPLSQQFAPHSIPASKATKAAHQHGATTAASALHDPSQDLLGVSESSSMSFNPKSMPRHFPSLAGVSIGYVPDIYISASDNAPSQQDELDLDLPTGVNSLDYLSAIKSSSISVGRCGTARTVPMTRKGRQNAPWTSEALIGDASYSSPEAVVDHVSQQYLTSQHQKRSGLDLRNLFDDRDSAYYTLSGPSHQDARSSRSAVSGPLNNQRPISNRIPAPDSVYPPSIAESQPQSLASCPDHKRIASDLETSAMPPSHPRHCPECNHLLTTPSQENKHMARHRPQFGCDFPDCSRANDKGFPTTNDLERHQKSVHKIRTGQYWRCFGQGCSKPMKEWPRLDNFKNHLIKLHRSECTEALVQRSEQWWRKTQAEQGNEARGAQLSQRVTAPGSVELDQGSRGGDYIRPAEIMLTADSGNLDHPFGYPDWRHTSTSYSHQPEMGMTRVSHPSNYDSSLGHLPASSGPMSTLDSDRFGELTHMTRPRVTGHLQEVSTSSLWPRRQSSYAGPLLMQRAATRGPLGPKESSLASPHRSTDQNNLLALPSGHRRGERYHANTAPNPDCAPFADAESELPSESPMSSINFSNILAQVGTGTHLNPQSTPSSTAQVMATGSLGHTPPLDLDPGERLLQQAIDSISALSKFSANGPGDMASRLAKIQAQIRSIANPTTEPVFDTAPSSTSPQAYRIEVSTDGKTLFCCPYPNCDKNSTRKAELNKHVKRHKRPYACTFDGCYKKFGSKNDLKRHEHSQHEQQEVWRCEEILSTDVGAGPKHCNSLWPTKVKFMDHLEVGHHIEDQSRRDLAVKQRIGRKHQGRFWCGFCRMIVQLTHKGIPGDNERFDHLCEHFLGEGRFKNEKADIDAWLLPYGHSTKGEVKAEREGAAKVAQQSRSEQRQVSDPANQEGEDSSESDASSEESSPPATTPSLPNEQPAANDHIEQPQSRQLPTQSLQATSHLRTPPRTGNNKKRTALEAFQEPSPSPSPSFRRKNSSNNNNNNNNHIPGPARKQKRGEKLAEFAICCRCQSDVDLNMAQTELLANSKRCLPCGHSFCDSCRYI